MKVWFEGAIALSCNLATVTAALEDHGAHYTALTKLMPGLSTVELVEQSPDSLVIRTNEGVMTRTGLTKTFDEDRVVVEFDEVYQAGSVVTASSHFREVFTPSSDGGVTFELTISGMEAPGVLGFFYRNFGSSNIGKAFLESRQTWAAAAGS